MSEAIVRRPSERRRQVVRGHRLVLFALALALIFYGLFTWASLVENRFDLAAGTAEHNLMLFGVSVWALLIIPLAIGAYVTHRAPRALYLVLNTAGVLAGLIWMGLQVAHQTISDWLLFDLAGIVIGAFVCWVFFFSPSARRFLAEKELMVKRV